MFTPYGLGHVPQRVNEQFQISNNVPKVLTHERYFLRASLGNGIACDYDDKDGPVHKVNISARAGVRRQS